MRTTSRILTIALSLTLGGAIGSALAQQPPLAEVARKAAEARQAAAKDKASKTYTNADLKRGRPLTVTGGSAGTPAAEAGAAGPAAPPAPADAKRVQDLRAYVAERQEEAKRLEQRIRDLNDAVLTSFDEQQRLSLVQERDATIAEIRKVQLDIEAQSKAAADLEAAAKSAPASPASAPPAPVAPPPSPE